MKIFMLTGAIIGFTLGLGFGLAQGAEWSSILLRASAAAALLGFLMRWWGRAWLRGLNLSLQERRAAEAAARLQSQPAKSLKK